MIEKGLIDLHVHSNYSDGKNSIEDIISMANSNNVKCISFAEHYNLDSYPKVLQIAINSGIEVIPAIEVGTDLSMYDLRKRSKCHMIIYYPSIKICDLLKEYHKKKDKVIFEILNNLKKIGINLPYEFVKISARNPDNICKFDIAIALSKLGVSNSPQEAYERYIDYGSITYVASNKMSPTELLKYVKSVGGVVSIAHPKSLAMTKEKFYDFIKELVELGLDEIEVYNPHNKLDRIQEYLELCDEFNLIPTVGSDYHGRENDNIEIGRGIDNNLCITDYSIVERIKKRRTI